MKGILAETGSAYFFQKAMSDETREEFKKLYEKDGSVIVTFKTGMAQIIPGENDLIDKPWNPRLKDKDGNPILDMFGVNKGNPRKPWDKFEAKAIIKDTETVYGFGGKNGILLKGFVAEMLKNKIKNSEIPNTKWKIRCNPPSNGSKYNTWSIEFLGRDETIKETKQENGETKPKSVDAYDKIVDAVRGVRDDNRGMVLAGIDRKDLVDALEYKVKLGFKIIDKYFAQLEQDEIIRIDGEKIFIL